MGDVTLCTAFLWIEDPQRAQRFANRFTRKNWERILSAIARRVNPLLKDLLSGMDYYWVTDQAEYATDVMFSDRKALQDLYEPWLQHATTCFGAEDVMTLLGRKLSGHFQGEVVTDRKTRSMGARVKHRMKRNWIKMYDKHGSILRIETVINQPREFKIRRQSTRRGKQVIDWYPMAKRIVNLYRYAEVSLAANGRYLDALAAVENPLKSKGAGDAVRRLAKPVRRRNRRYRGINPACQKDARLLKAVLRGEHAIHGIRNENVRRRLHGDTKCLERKRRQARQVTRHLQRLHAHGLIAKVPRSRSWRITRRANPNVLVTFHRHKPARNSSRLRTVRSES